MNAMLQGGSPEPVSVASRSPVAGSDNRRVPPAEALTSRSPSGETARSHTQAGCALMVSIGSRLHGPAPALSRGRLPASNTSSRRSRSQGPRCCSGALGLHLLESCTSALRSIRSQVLSHAQNRSFWLAQPSCIPTRPRLDPLTRPRIGGVFALDAEAIELQE